MKARIEKDGKLFLIPESSTEQFAIETWILGDEHAANYPIGFTEFVEKDDDEAERD